LTIIKTSGIADSLPKEAPPEAFPGAPFMWRGISFPYPPIIINKHIKEESCGRTWRLGEK
jgi:hypothetical protein